MTNPMTSTQRFKTVAAGSNTFPNCAFDMASNDEDYDQLTQEQRDEVDQARREKQEQEQAGT